MHIFIVRHRYIRIQLILVALKKLYSCVTMEIEINKIYKLNEISVNRCILIKNTKPYKTSNGYNLLNRFIDIDNNNVLYKDIMIHVLNEPCIYVDVDFRVYTNFKCILSIQNKSELVNLSVSMNFENYNKIISTNCFEEVL